MIIYPDFIKIVEIRQFCTQNTSISRTRQGFVNRLRLLRESNGVQIREFEGVKSQNGQKFKIFKLRDHFERDKYQP